MSQALLKLAKVDKTKYTAQTLSIIDVMACYFLDMLYNVLYLRVKELKKTEKISNITEGYKNALMVYYKGLNNNDNLTKCIENIQRTFNEQPGFSNVSFLECINNIVEQFSPKDAFDGFGDKEKRILLKKVVIDVNSAFISHILNSRLRMIIDERKNKQSVNILKGELMDFFLLEREKIISEYYGVVLNVEKTGSVSTQTAERLQKIISDTVTKMVIYKKQAEKFKEMATQYKFELDQLKGKNSSTQVLQSSSTQLSSTQNIQPSKDGHDSDDILELSDSDNVEVSEDNDENELERQFKAPDRPNATNSPSSTTQQKPQIPQIQQTSSNIDEESSDLFEDNLPTSIPKITVDDLSIGGDDETPQNPGNPETPETQKTHETPTMVQTTSSTTRESPEQESHNEFELELENIVKKSPVQTSKNTQYSAPNNSIPQKNVVRMREDPLATESETSAIKIKKSGSKLKIKKDVPVKKVQFN